MASSRRRPGYDHQLVNTGSWNRFAKPLNLGDGAMSGTARSSRPAPFI
jgi:hypothetical protein